MSNSILIPLSESRTSRAVIDYITKISFCPEDSQITLLNIYKKPSASQDLMGKKFVAGQEARIAKFLNDVKDNLVESGIIAPDKIKIIIEKTPYPTIADGIIDQFDKGDFSMIVIGRKQMTKAEEFVMGDVSVKLIRALKKAAILVVKSE